MAVAGAQTVLVDAGIVDVPKTMGTARTDENARRAGTSGTAGNTETVDNAETAKTVDIRMTEADLMNEPYFTAEHVILQTKMMIQRPHGSETASELWGMKSLLRIKRSR